MLFRRRNKPGIAERVRQSVWPTSGWKRATSYFFKRVMRLSGSPHAIAAGFAAGVFASFTPFFGFHFIISFVVAFFIGGNMLAAALGTAVGNPLTFPPILVSSYTVGSFMLGTGPSGLAPHEMLLSLTKQPIDAVIPLLQPLIVGGVPLGTIFGAIAYVMVWWAVRAYQRARRTRLATRRAAVRPDNAKAGAHKSA